MLRQYLKKQSFLMFKKRSAIKFCIEHFEKCRSEISEYLMFYIANQKLAKLLIKVNNL